MKWKIPKSYNNSALMCYLYIFVVILSFLAAKNKPIFSAVTLTGTIISISILLDLKKILNQKFLYHKVDFYLIIFVIIKSITTFFDILFHNEFLDFISNYGHIFFGITGILQIIYSFMLIITKFRGLEKIKTYGLFSFLSGLMSLTTSYSIFQLFFSLISVYVLANVFFESEEIANREHS